MGDVVENRVIKYFFKDYVYVFVVFFTKGVTGYLLGVVGAFEVVFIVLVCYYRKLLFILNFDCIELEFDFNYVLFKV